MRKAAFALCFLALILPARQAAALEDVPGGSCAGVPTNAFRWAGGPENGGVVNSLFCNTNWLGVINFQSSGYVGIGTTTPTAQLHLSTPARPPMPPPFLATPTVPRAGPMA